MYKTNLPRKKFAPSPNVSAPDKEKGKAVTGVSDTTKHVKALPIAKSKTHTKSSNTQPGHRYVIKSQKTDYNTLSTTTSAKPSQGSKSKIASKSRSTKKPTEPMKLTTSAPPNLYLVGPQCAGKTTLLRALQTHYAKYSHRKFGARTMPPPSTVDEVVRTGMQTQNFTVHDLQNDPDRGFELQKQILLAQHVAEKPLVEAGTWYMSDRSGIDALVYAKIHVSDNDAVKLAGTPERKALQKNMQFENAVVVFCEAGNEEWLSSDTVRMAYDSKEEWEALNGAYRLMMLKYDVKYITIPKYIRDLTERVGLVAKSLTMAPEEGEEVVSSRK